MKTVLLKPHETDLAANVLKNSGVVAIPSETVYGLAANIFDNRAIQKIFTAKGRPSDNPLIVHIAEIDDVFPLVFELPYKAEILINNFWPAPLTLILSKSSLISDLISASLPTVAVRCPNNKIFREVIKKCGFPLAAPSANLSGSPSPTKFEHVFNDLNSCVDAIIDGGDCEFGIESTVIDVSKNTPILLRPGVITPEEITNLIGEIQIDKAVLSELSGSEKPNSPGLKYKHYAPKAKVVLVNARDENSQSYIDFVNENANEKGVFALCFDEDVPLLKIPSVSYGSKNNQTQQASKLFDSLRKCDELGAKIIYANSPKKTGVGLAVYNRMLRSASFNVIDL